MQDRIEKNVELKASPSRVWRALTDSAEFGEWFRAKFEGPFVPGEPARGKLLVPGYEHLQMDIVIARVEPESYFSFTWHPYAIDPAKDYSGEPPTLVEFRLEPVESGTRLSVTESGFSKLPAERFTEAFPMNTRGWEGQLRNIEKYVHEHA